MTATTALARAGRARAVASAFAEGVPLGMIVFPLAMASAATWQRHGLTTASQLTEEEDLARMPSQRLTIALRAGAGLGYCLQVHALGALALSLLWLVHVPLLVDRGPGVLLVTAPATILYGATILRVRAWMPPHRSSCSAHGSKGDRSSPASSWSSGWGR